MPVLKNIKHEMFAHAIAKGETYTSAYIKCGYQNKNPGIAGSRLAKTDKISVRVSEIQQNIAEMAQEKSNVTKAYVLECLQEIAERCLERKPVLDKDGNEIGEWVFNATGANKALELIGKELGMFKERIEHSGDLDVASRIIAARKRSELPVESVH